MIDFTGKVALVTGAGAGLGRAHALALAARGARVVVNDIARPATVDRPASSPATEVAREIERAGGVALPVDASVIDPQAVQEMVALVTERWGTVDILVNNAGFVRDKSFTKLGIDDIRAVLDVHLMGAVHCTRAVWDGMKARNHGRIVFTTSSSGLWGNFGQANYAAAKMALVGLMQTLALEGMKHDIRVNCLAPTAATPMTDGLIPPALVQALDPSAVTPGLLWLVSADAPTRMILCAGAGSFAAAHVSLTQGVQASTPEELGALAVQLADRTGSTVPASGTAQSQQEIARFETRGR